MKCVMLSIRPQWVEKIASGEKTIEVRETRPKIETPFKCYIYCTIGNGVKGNYLVQSGIQCGKVVGEFICDKIVKYRYTKPWLYNGKKIYHLPLDTINTCLSYNEIEEYLGNKDGYGWNISELKIYDKPKELGKFKHWMNNKDYDGWNEQRTKIIKGFVLRPLTRPPQSWCYVEEL